MRRNDAAIWVGMGAVLLYVWSRSKVSTAPPAFVFEGMLPPDTLPGVSINIGNQVAQPPFQGGTRSPRELDQAVIYNIN
jgi:hypothetical protein